MYNNSKVDNNKDKNSKSKNGSIPLPAPATSSSMTRFVSLSNMYIQSSDSLRVGSSSISSLLSGSSWSTIPSDSINDTPSNYEANVDCEGRAVLPEGWNDAPPLFQEHEETLTWIKTMIRQGVPHPLRCAMWLSNVVLIVHHDLDLAKEFRTLSKVRMLDQTYATVLDQQVRWKRLLPPDADEDLQREAASSVPTFGNHDWEHHLLLALDAVTGGRLPMAGQLARTKVLMALETTLGMEYSPMLPTLVSLLLMVMSESYAFATVREMLHAPGYLTPYYLATNAIEYMAQARAFADVLTKLHPQTAQTMQDLGILPRRLSEDLQQIEYDDDDDDDENSTRGLAPIFQDFFVSLLPIPQVLRIMDIFTLEGIKVLFRVGVALVCLFQRDCAAKARQIERQHEWWDAIHNYTHDPSSPYQFDVLLKKAYGVHGHVVQGGGGSGPPPRRGSRRRVLRQQPIRFPTRYILARIMKMEEEQVRLALAERRLKYPKMTSSSSSKYKKEQADERMLITARPLGLIDRFSEAAEAVAAAAVPHPQLTSTSSLEQPSPLEETLEESPLADSLYPHRFASDVVKEEIPRPVLAQSIHVRTSLAQWLPLALRFTNLDLIFSTNFHGRSLERFYNHVEHTSKTLLLAQILLDPNKLGKSADDSNNEGHKREEVVIGMYASQPWKPTPHVYGDGECFLFRLSPDPQAWKWKPRLPAPSRPNEDDDDNQDDVSFFLPRSKPQQQTSAAHFDNTTALREQFMVATSQYISMGANPDGSCGLRLNEDLTRGASSRALGFDNEPLVPNHDMFEVGLVEVYRMLRQFDGHAT